LWHFGVNAAPLGRAIDRSPQLGQSTKQQELLAILPLQLAQYGGVASTSSRSLRRAERFILAVDAQQR
jgi:hypothetical protein